MIRLPTEADRVLIVVNPKAGSGSGKAKVERLVASLARHHLKAELLPELAAVADRAAEVEASGRLRAVIGAGGDGTIAEIINRCPAGVPIAMLPLGTENLLSKYVDLPRVPEEIAEVIAAGAVVPHDAGKAGSRLFFLMMSCGFDAEVIRRLQENRQGHIRHWSYFKPIWHTIRSYEYPELRIYCDPVDYNPGDGDGGIFDGQPSEPIRACFAFAFNIPRYAFGFQFAPDAEGDDGLLDICTFRCGSFRHGLWYLVNVILGRHRQLTDCSTLRARRIRVEADVPVPYNLDGDFCGFLPLEVEIIPERLMLLVPPGWAERHRAKQALAIPQ